MGRSDIVTLLPMDRYAQIQGLNTVHFNQLNGVKAPVGKCDDLWDQDARDALAWTMKQAEDLIIKELGFYPVPTFITDEEQEFNLPGVRSDWRNAELATDWKYVTCFGTETLTLLQANATVEYLDLDADPLEREEWGEIGGLVYQDLPACTDPCSVRVFSGWPTALKMPPIRAGKFARSRWTLTARQCVSGRDLNYSCGPFYGT